MYWFFYPIGFMLNTLWMPNVGRFKVIIDVVLLPLATSFRLKTLTCLYQKGYQDQCEFTPLFTIVLVPTLPMWFHGILFKFIQITQPTVLRNSVVPTLFRFSKFDANYCFICCVKTINILRVGPIIFVDVCLSKYFDGDSQNQEFSTPSHQIFNCFQHK